LLALAAVTGYLLPGHDQLRVFWTAIPLVDACLFLIGLAVSRRPALAPAERRLWRAVAVEGFVIMCGDAYQAVLVWSGHAPPGLAPGPVTSLCNLIGIMPPVYVLLTYRTAPGSGRSGSATCSTRRRPGSASAWSCGSSSRPPAPPTGTGRPGSSAR
jgi:hypothetical protein